MTPLTQSEPQAATDSEQATPAVLYALSERERRLFFPGELPPGALWQDTRGLGQASWNRLLQTHRPRIIVSSWCTPRVDTARTTLGEDGTVDYVCHVSGSVRHVVSREQIAAGLKVTNWSTLVAPIVAEHALLLVLAAMRKLPAWREQIMNPEVADKSWLETRTLHGARISIHGFGAIAREFIRLIKPFNVSISVFSHGVPDAVIIAAGATPVASLSELAANASIFVTCEALTEISRGSIDARILNGLQHGAVFVNVGRGAIVNEDDLLAVAHARNLRVSSDVFTHEPLTAESPFMHLPGALISPHIAGPTQDFFPVCGRHALGNIARYLSGKAPSGLITAEVYDRST